MYTSDGRRKDQQADDKSHGGSVHVSVLLEAGGTVEKTSCHTIQVTSSARHMPIRMQITCHAIDR